MLFLLTAKFNGEEDLVDISIIDIDENFICEHYHLRDQLDDCQFCSEIGMRDKESISVKKGEENTQRDFSGIFNVLLKNIAADTPNEARIESLVKVLQTYENFTKTSYGISKEHKHTDILMTVYIRNKMEYSITHIFYF